MSNIDIEALRKAAEALGGEAWSTETGVGTFDGMHVWAMDGDSICRTFANLGHMPEGYDEVQVAEYIAAANPAVILALLDERLALLDRLERAEAAAGAVPEGFVLVPLDPPLAMAKAFRDADTNGDRFLDGYAAMIAAAPPAQGLPAAPDDVLDAKRHRYTRATTTAIRDPETGERIEITPEMYDAAIDRAMARDPDAKLGIKAKDMPAAAPSITSLIEQHGSILSAANEQSRLAAAPSEPVADARLDLLNQVDSLCSQIEESLYAFRDDAEARRKAQGAIDHAKKVVEPYRWNGATPPAQDAGTGDATIVAIGYESGFMATDPDHDGATVKLHYRDEATAEAAFCAITRIIDRAIANSGRT